MFSSILDSFLSCFLWGQNLQTILLLEIKILYLFCQDQMTTTENTFFILAFYAL